MGSADSVPNGRSCPSQGVWADSKDSKLRLPGHQRKANGQQNANENNGWTARTAKLCVSLRAIY